MAEGNFIGYLRLKGSKLPVVNFTHNTYDRILKTLDDDGIGPFMQYIYDYIYKGTDYNFKTKLYQNLWKDTLTQINKSADWYFKKKEEEKQLKELKKTISEEFDI